MGPRGKRETWGEGRKGGREVTEEREGWETAVGVQWVRWQGKGWIQSRDGLARKLSSFCMFSNLWVEETISFEASLIQSTLTMIQNRKADSTLIQKEKCSIERQSAMAIEGRRTSEGGRGMKRWILHPYSQLFKIENRSADSALIQLNIVKNWILEMSEFSFSFVCTQNREVGFEEI